MHIGDEAEENRQGGDDTSRGWRAARIVRFKRFSVAFTRVHKWQSRSDRIAASLQLWKYEKVGEVLKSVALRPTCEVDEQSLLLHLFSSDTRCSP